MVAHERERAPATKTPAAEQGRSDRATEPANPLLLDRPSTAADNKLVAAPDAVLRLQRGAGNRATLTWLRAQAKLSVGAVDDPLEREADATARRVVQALRSAVAPHGPVADRVHRTAQVGAEGGDVDPAIERQLSAARGLGTPMDPAVRRNMEQAFDTDFSGVRVHTGPTADTLARNLTAEAFTRGSDIFFRSGSYDPSSSRGQTVLAHE